MGRAAKLLFLNSNSISKSQFADSLLGADGVLVRLCKDESQDTDVLCGAIQCVANMCTK